MKTEAAIENYILPWPLFANFVLVLWVLIVMQFIFAPASPPIVQIQNTSCRIISVGVAPNSNSAVAKLSCENKGKQKIERRTKNTRFILSYLQDPRPFTCTLYAGDKTDCTLKKEE